MSLCKPDRRSEEHRRLQWKIYFCEHYANKLKNPEKIAECLLEGSDISNYFEIPYFFNTLRQCCKLLKLGDDHNDCKVLDLFGKNRNFATYLCTWNFQYVFALLNYSLTQDYYALFMKGIDALPPSQKVSTQIQNSFLLEKVLLKFIGCTEIPESGCTETSGIEHLGLIFFSIFVRQFKGNESNDPISKNERILMSEANKKIEKIFTMDINENIRSLFERLNNVMHIDPNVPTKLLFKFRKQLLKEKKERFRKQFPAKCFNTSCSKSICSKANYCKKCFYASYCSKKCQVAHWKPVHKKECRILHKIGKNLRPLLNEKIQCLKAIS